MSPPFSTIISCSIYNANYGVVPTWAGGAPGIEGGDLRSRTSHTFAQCFRGEDFDLRAEAEDVAARLFFDVEDHIECRPAVWIGGAGCFDAPVGSRAGYVAQYLGRDVERDRIARQVGDELRARLSQVCREVEIRWADAWLVCDSRGADACDAIGADRFLCLSDEIPHTPLRHEAERVHQPLDGVAVRAP